MGVPDYLEPVDDVISNSSMQLISEALPDMGQVSSIAGHIIDKINAYETLVSDKVVGRYPTVFVKRGFYEDSRLYLVVKNKEEDSGFSIDGNLRTTETAEEINFHKAVALDRSDEQEIVVEAGSLYDIGLQIKGNNSPHRLERNVIMDGSILETANIFRSILPGDQVFDPSSYAALNFCMQNDHPLEIILVTEGLENWEDRYRLKVDNNTTKTDLSLKLSNFFNGSTYYNQEKLKAVVFSIQGNYSSFQDFNLSISRVTFGEVYEYPEILPIPGLPAPGSMLDSVAEIAYNYPNPFKSQTTVVAPMEAETAELYMYDLSGKKV